MPNRVMRYAKDKMSTLMSKPMMAWNEDKITTKQMGVIMKRKHSKLRTSSKAYQKAYNEEAKEIKKARKYN